MDQLNQLDQVANLANHIHGNESADQIPDRTANGQKEVLAPLRVPQPIGSRVWAIAEGYIPSESTGPHPQMTSHETACLLNTCDVDANVEIMIYFSDREPVGPYKTTVQARRTKHLRFNDLKDPEMIPRDTDYSSVITSDQPIVVQHTRLDSRQAENALISTMAYSSSAG